MLDTLGDLSARLRESPGWQSAATSAAPVEPSDAEAVRLWAESLGLRRGAYASPPASHLRRAVERWCLEQGWGLAPTAIRIAQGLKRHGLRGRQANRRRGYGVTEAQARELWRQAGRDYPEGVPAMVKPARWEPVRRLPARVEPLVREVPRSQWAKPLVDSTGAVWPGLEWAGRSVKAAARVLKAASEPKHEGRRVVKCRLWRRLPKDLAWLALLPPEARVGQPGTLCWCNLAAPHAPGVTAAQALVLPPGTTPAK